MMLEGLDLRGARSGAAHGHLFDEAFVIEFAAEFAERFIQEVTALNRSDGGAAGAEERLAFPRAAGIGGDGDVRDLIPLDAGAVKAETDRFTRDAGGGAVAGEFAFFDGGENAGIAEQRGCRVMTHRR